MPATAAARRSAPYVLGLCSPLAGRACIGPVLGSILALAAQQGIGRARPAADGLLCGGAQAPFPLTALFLRHALSLMAGMKRRMALIERAMGVLLIRSAS